MNYKAHESYLTDIQENECYEEFRTTIYGGNIPQKKFLKMLRAEATYEQSANNSLHRGDAMRNAVNRMAQWFRDGFEKRVRIDPDNLSDWIATYRITALWCMALGAEHRMED